METLSPSFKRSCTSLRLMRHDWHSFSICFIVGRRPFHCFAGRKLFELRGNEKSWLSIQIFFTWSEVSPEQFSCSGKDWHYLFDYLIMIGLIMLPTIMGMEIFVHNNSLGGESLIVKSRYSTFSQYLLKSDQLQVSWNNLSNKAQYIVRTIFKATQIWSQFMKCCCNYNSCHEQPK